MNYRAKTQFALGAAFALVLTCSACGGSANQQASDNSSSSTLPRLNGRNAVVASGVDAVGFVNDSLDDWTTEKSDFVAVATVESERLVPSATENTQSESRPSMQKIKIGDVLWTNPDGVAVPQELEIIGWGFNLNNDTGDLKPIVPSGGPRLQPGDTFVGSFSNDTHRFSAEYTKSPEYQQLPSHWGIFTERGVLKIVDGKIVTEDRTTAYEKPFAGLTVEEFGQKLTSAAKAS